VHEADRVELFVAGGAAAGLAGDAAGDIVGAVRIAALIFWCCCVDRYRRQSAVVAK
jgi:hypothetical protein